MKCDKPAGNQLVRRLCWKELRLGTMETRNRKLWLISLSFRRSHPAALIRLTRSLLARSTSSKDFLCGTLSPSLRSSPSSAWYETKFMWRTCCVNPRDLVKFVYLQTCPQLLWRQRFFWGEQTSHLNYARECDSPKKRLQVLRVSRWCLRWRGGWSLRRGCCKKQCTKRWKPVDRTRQYGHVHQYENKGPDTQKRRFIDTCVQSQLGG